MLQGTSRACISGTARPEGGVPRQIWYGRWVQAKVTLTPKLPRLGHRFSAAVCCCFRGTLDTAGWQQPSPSALARGPSGDSLPPSWQLAAQPPTPLLGTGRRHTPAAQLPPCLCPAPRPCPGRGSAAMLQNSLSFPRTSAMLQSSEKVRQSWDEKYKPQGQSCEYE